MNEGQAIAGILTAILILRAGLAYRRALKP